MHSKSKRFAIIFNCQKIFEPYNSLFKYISFKQLVQLKNTIYSKFRYDNRGIGIEEPTPGPSHQQIPDLSVTTLKDQYASENECMTGGEQNNAETFSLTSTPPSQIGMLYTNVTTPSCLLII